MGILVGYQRHTCYGILLAMIVISAPAALAQEALPPLPTTYRLAPARTTQFERTTLPDKAPIAEDEPVTLEASEMNYDQENQVVSASGQVEVNQGETVILADELIYDQKNNLVRARGNVSLMEAGGNVIFADEAELKNDLKAGVIRQFKARLSDNSLFVAARARKIDENRTELDKAVYSPCKVGCDSDGGSDDPMWQLKAGHVLIDEKEQIVTYDDADLEVYGVPVFYTPYLSHATPGADNKSGFLAPEFQQNGNLGTIFKVPYYYSISPDRDLTLTPIITGKEGLVMAGEYRQKLDSGEYILDGSITRPQDRNGLGYVDPGKEFRGHIDAKGDFTLDEDYGWGFDIRRTTDDTYLRRYGLSQDTLLTSRLYAEGFNFVDDSDRTYANVQALSFQGLTATDDQDRIPVVAPLAEFTYESDPGIYNSRTTMDANLMALTRDIGAKSRRMSGRAGWKLPFITSDGQILEFETSLRSDIYAVEDVALSDGRNFDGTTGRVVPEVSLTWRYPFLNEVDEQTSYMIEPIVAFNVSPNGGNPEDIPNEDSNVPEFTDSNLFSANRFAGYDRIESGPRMSYGMRGQAQFYSDKYVDWVFGQHYRMEADRNFPFSNDLDDHFSDYVGKIAMHYMPFDVAYRFRLDKEDLTAKRSEVDASANYYPLTLSGSYLSLTNDPILANKEEIYGAAGLNLTPEWQWTVGGRYDLELEQITSTSTGLIFKNECTYFTSVLGREYTRDRDVKPTTSFIFRVSLKNLE